MIKKTLVALALCTSSNLAFSDNKNYSCGELALDNKTQAAVQKTYVVDGYLLYLQDAYIQESAKKSSLEYYEKEKAKDAQDAYFKSLDIYKNYLDIRPQVKKNIEKQGGLNAKVSKVCNTLKNDKFPIYEIYNTIISLAIFEEMIKMNK